MRKHILVALFLIFVPYFTSSADAEEIFIDRNDPGHIDKILATDPATISKEQFYQAESAIMSGYSGSGGYSLEEPLIAWLRKAENTFKAKGIKLKDDSKRHFAFADSYFNQHNYEKALSEFRESKDQGGIELAEWFMHNKGMENGTITIKEYPGKMVFDASTVANVEGKDYLFSAYFKGPVYRYDKKKDTHALIYASEDKYDWCHALAFAGEDLIIKLRDNAGTFIFDNSTNEITRLVKSFDITTSEAAVFSGADFYELSPIIDNLKLSPDHAKIAFTVWDKSKDVYNNIGIVYIDAPEKRMLLKVEVNNLAWLSDAEVIYELQGSKKFQIYNLNGQTKESNIKVDFAEAFEAPEIVKARLNDFIAHKYKPHYGVLGGSVNYSVENCVPSPDKKKIAFLVIGCDGHMEFYPAWYVCSSKGESITAIDSTGRYMSGNVVWLSDNELAYVKDARLWKAYIK